MCFHRNGLSYHCKQNLDSLLKVECMASEEEGVKVSRVGRRSPPVYCTCVWGEYFAKESIRI